MSAEQPTFSRLAITWAERSYLESSLLNSHVNSELHKASPDTPTTSKKDYISNKAQLLDKILLTDNYELSKALMAAYNYNLISNNVISGLVESISLSGKFLNCGPEELNQIAYASSRPYIEILLDRIYPSHDSLGANNIFILNYRSRELGQELQVSQYQIFESDQLYKRLVRSTDTPFDVARESLKVAENLGPEFFIESLLVLLEILFKNSGEYPEGYELLRDINPVEKEQLITKLSEEGPIRKKGLDFMADKRKSARVGAIFKIKRFWGESGLNLLPQDMVKRLFSDV